MDNIVPNKTRSTHQTSTVDAAQCRLQHHNKWNVGNCNLKWPYDNGRHVRNFSPTYEHRIIWLFRAPCQGAKWTLSYTWDKEETHRTYNTFTCMIHSDVTPAHFLHNQPLETLAYCFGDTMEKEFEIFDPRGLTQVRHKPPSWTCSPHHKNIDTKIQTQSRRKTMNTKDWKHGHNTHVCLPLYRYVHTYADKLKKTYNTFRRTALKSTCRTN